MVGRAVLLLIAATAGVVLVAGPRDVAPTAAAAAVAAEEAPPAVTPISEQVTLTTTSHLRDTWRGNSTQARGWVLLEGDCPDELWAELATSDSDGRDRAVVRWTEGTEVQQPIRVLGNCRVPIRVDDVELTQSAAGVLVLRSRGVTARTVPATIVRTSGAWVYGLVFLVAVAVGVGTAIVLRWLVRNRTVPKEWKFSDAYASATTGLVAAAAALLTATGVLSEYAPQYATGGVLAANIGVAALVLLAPLVFTGLVGRKPLRAFSVAAGITVVAATAQAFLVLVVVVSGSTSGVGKFVGLGVTVVLVALLVWYAVKTAKGFPIGAPPQPWHPPSASL